MAPIRPTELHQRRFRLTREPTAAAEARSRVRAVIRPWKVPVDPDIAVLLTSDLVTSVIMHGNGETVMLVIRCPRDPLRIDVYDTSRSPPIAADEPAGTEAGRGLALVAALDGMGLFPHPLRGRPFTSRSRSGSICPVVAHPKDTNQ